MTSTDEGQMADDTHRQAHGTHDPGRADQREHWDERHRSGDFEGHGPNPTLMAALDGLAPGRALELAAGAGTNAVWMAQRGWRVTAVDWSPVGLSRGREAARAAGVEVEFLERDLLTWNPPVASFDLVAMVYLHLPPDERRIVMNAATAALAPEGRLVVIGHDRRSAIEGGPGPRDPLRLFSAPELAAEIASSDADLVVERAEAVRRGRAPGPVPVDALVVIRRLGGARAAPRASREGRGIGPVGDAQQAHGGGVRPAQGEDPRPAQGEDPRPAQGEDPRPAHGRNRHPQDGLEGQVRT